eukprot:6283738-Amphidinium_carterae.1
MKEYTLLVASATKELTHAEEILKACQAKKVYYDAMPAFEKRVEFLRDCLNMPLDEKKNFVTKKQNALTLSNGITKQTSVTEVFKKQLPIADGFFEELVLMADLQTRLDVGTHGSAVELDKAVVAAKERFGPIRALIQATTRLTRQAQAWHSQKSEGQNVLKKQMTIRMTLK